LVPSRKLLRAIFLTILFLCLLVDNESTIVDRDSFSTASQDLQLIVQAVARVFKGNNDWPHKYVITSVGNWIRVELTQKREGDDFVIRTRELIDSVAVILRGFLPLGREGEAHRIYFEKQGTIIATIVTMDTIVAVVDGPSLVDATSIGFEGQ